MFLTGLTNLWFLFIVVFFYLVLMLVSFSWSGIYYYVESGNLYFLFYMSIMMLGLIYLSEKNIVLKKLSFILVMISLLFFFSSNILMLYVFFELSMFPILIMILGFGQQVEKVGASYYLMFYASICSFPFLYFIFSGGYFMFSYMTSYYSWEMTFFMTMCFLMKFPVYFLHLWLPKAHVEAPTTASMLLAGLLLKLGTIGYYRLLKSLISVSIYFYLLISIISMLVSAFLSMMQSDSKSLAAYSSISHMGLLLFGLLMFNLSNKSSSVILMISHGFTSTLMFYLIGEFYHSIGSRMVYYFNSFFSMSVMFGVLFFVVFLSNMGVPPSLSFFSEYFIVAHSWMLNTNMFIFVFLYFMYSFYYSLYYISNCISGSGWASVCTWGIAYSYFMVFLMYNIMMFIIMI